MIVYGERHAISDTLYSPSFSHVCSYYSILFYILSHHTLQPDNFTLLQERIVMK